MRYLPFKSEIHVDHFDPTHKDDKYQQYTNLFPADARCNLTKSDQWPTEEERAQGIRFLNCCEEVDYGECIFEEPETGKLVGTTVAARYHIEALLLNCYELCQFRRERTRIARVIDSADRANIGALSDPHASAAVEELRRGLEQKIPFIPPPPTQ